MLGLKRGAVRLCQHESEWEAEAKNTISQLREILGPAITDIQHIGSTAIPSIKAIPIIDIAIAADRLEDILEFRENLRTTDFTIAQKRLNPDSFCSPAAAITMEAAICRHTLSMSFPQAVRHGETI